MTRPDVERIRSVFDRPGQPEHVEVIADLCHWVLAMEAARDAVLPAKDDTRFHRWSREFLRVEFDAAMARWTL